MFDAYDTVILSESDKQEIKRNTQGKIIMGVSAVLILFACAGAVALGVIGLIGIIVGFFMTVSNKSEYTIRQEKALAKTAANLMVAQAQAGQKIDLDTPTAQKARQKEETKEIIKGAVVGSIVAGDVGAVVGATIAKNKIDNEKK